MLGDFLRGWGGKSTGGALVVLLSAAFFGPCASAADCNAAGNCVGDRTWDYYQGSIHAGVVVSFAQDGRVNFKADGEGVDRPIAADHVAVAKPGACLPAYPKACVGYQSTRKSAAGAEIRGKVIGYFANGFVAVAEGDARFSLAPDMFTGFSGKPCTKDDRLCTGDEALMDNGHGLAVVKVDDVDPGQDTVSAGWARFPAGNFANINQAGCGQDSAGARLCPGAPAMNGNGEVGTVLGVFADGTLAFASRTGLARVGGKMLTLHPPAGDERHQIIDGLAALAGINDLLQAANWQDCSGEPPPAPRPHFLPSGAVDCDEPAGPVTADDSPNKQKFRDLLAKGMNAPLSDFLNLWYPDRGDGLNLDSPFFKCEDHPGGGFTNLEAGCQPDVLFSWGPEVKKKTVMQNLADGKSWSGNANSYGTVYTSISPSATFGYGDILLRFKVKPGTKFVFDGYGTAAVSVRSDTFHDFAISDSSIIESVSFGTPEIYDEVVRDVLHYQAGKRASAYFQHYHYQWEPPEEYGGKKDFGYEAGEGIDRLYNQEVDYHVMNEDELKRHLLEMVREILAGEGRINYAQGACRSRAITFSSRNPDYVEPLETPAK